MGIKNILSARTDVLKQIGNPHMKHPIQHDLITFESFTSAIKNVARVYFILAICYTLGTLQKPDCDRL